jgi:heme/copper-type cytochrome/quinol oxidase subunit 2
MAELIALSLVVVGGVVFSLVTYYRERRRQMDWHHEMMLEAYQDGWDAACQMMKHREEQGR